MSTETLAQMAADDRADAFVRNSLQLPFGGLYDPRYAIKVPFIDADGNVGVARFDRWATADVRDCTACLSGARSDGGPCESECGRPGVWRVRIGSTVETACESCAPDMLAAAAVAIRITPTPPAEAA